MSAPATSEGTGDRMLLLSTLAVAVPMHIARMRDWSTERRAAAAQVDADVIASHGDDLLFGGRHTAAAFNSLARALALLADRPGGVGFAGQHWCTHPHAGCPYPRTGKHRIAGPDAGGSA